MKIIRRWVDEQSLSAIDTVSASNRPKRQRRYSGVEKITIWNSCPKVQYRSSSPCGRVLAMSVVRTRGGHSGRMPSPIEGVRIFKLLQLFRLIPI
ncbi:hypothetical protein [Sinorhizobium meliloti]|uniref:hypothetical protein n=1 Tax=Rhizobium meliloti TaxID=382 RepID=UPI00238095FE|nr:hypothetical protein [Sinorhizobium meliloti]